MVRSMRTAALPTIFAGLTLAASSLSAQIPSEFTNLELLPKDIERGQLIGTMKNWASGLGVRCTHCHVGPDNLQGMDFASDEKSAKRTARRMLEMSRRINGELLEDLPTVEGKHQIVSCYTCHRGQVTPPRNAFSMLETAYSGGGVAAALQEYDRLLAEHGGRGRYDLSTSMLERFARRRLEARQAEDAVTVLERATSKPDRTADTYSLLGMAYMELGNPAKARESFLAALVVDPEHEMSRRAISQLPQ